MFHIRGNMIQLCNIQVLISHIAGVVGKRFPVDKDERFVGIYQFESACGSLVCCFVGGDHVYFDAEKVRITAAVGGKSDRYYVGSTYTSEEPKTYYVMDGLNQERAVDNCGSWKRAEQEAERLNQELASE